MLRSQQDTFAMLEILDKDSRSEDKRRDLEGKLANESVSLHSECMLSHVSTY